jgi:hypothetical protein
MRENVIVALRAIFLLKIVFDHADALSSDEQVLADIFSLAEDDYSRVNKV